MFDLDVECLIGRYRSEQNQLSDAISDECKNSSKHLEVVNLTIILAVAANISILKSCSPHVVEMSRYFEVHYQEIKRYVDKQIFSNREFEDFSLIRVALLEGI